MIIGIVAAPVMAIYNFLMYMLVRRELSKQTQKNSVAYQTVWNALL